MANERKTEQYELIVKSLYYVLENAPVSIAKEVTKTILESAKITLMNSYMNDEIG